MKSKIDISALRANAPWHRESWDKFINENLPQLLAERLPLTKYTVISDEDFSSRIEIGVGEAEVTYCVLSPNQEGLFRVGEGYFVVVPTASDENLDTAEIKCVGEQLLDYVQSHLGEANGDLPWDQALVQAWLPLETWVHEVVTSAVPYDYQNDRWATGQWLDQTNTLAAITHLRRIIIPNIENVIAPGQLGRVCPFETPEGPNIGHVLHIAVGARIRDGRIEIVDDRPEATLGVSASTIPFLEHNDPNRQLMGTNMQRQSQIPPDPEPALIQTGCEPDVPGIWTGRNLLTAFVSMGAETYEDSLLVSESAAKRLSYSGEAHVGDKLHNRHGQKGVISRILPDDQMPRLADGTPVDLVCSFIALHTRKDFGQIREAVISRIARAEGRPIIVPPFHAPGEQEIRERLRKAGLPEDGMEVLFDPRLGRDLDGPSVAGWVYWSHSVHTAADKIHAYTHGPKSNSQGWLEYYALRDIGCFETILNHYSTCSNDRPDAEDFVKQVAAGPVQQAEPPTPKFADLCRRLSAVGISADFTGDGISFRLIPPSGDVLKLARPVPHPWLREHTLTEIGRIEDLADYDAVADANAKLEQMIANNAPPSLVDKALADLQDRVNAFFDALITPDHLRMGNRVMFNGRTVLAPGLDLRLDQVGLAEEIAWTLFAPLVTRELGDETEVEKRTQKATEVLDEVMARSWVIVTRAPAFMPTATMAFHPVRIPDPVIRIHPLVCFLMNADFDGDQAAVFLPITEAAQREAGEKLSLAGHLRRAPNLFDLRFIYEEHLWGLARLSLQSGGIDETNEIAGVEVATSGGIVDRDTIAAALREVMNRDGVEATMQAMQRLMDRGMQVARESGASINPFIGSTLALPAAPECEDPDEWKAYVEEIIDLLQRDTDYDWLDLGPQLLAVKSGARGGVQQLVRLVSASGLVTDAAGNHVPIRHSFAQGLTPEEMFACVAGARQGLAHIACEIERGTWPGYDVRAAHEPKGFGVLARAMRASQPGRVLARAAASGEVDPLTDLDSRLFVGLRP